MVAGGGIPIDTAWGAVRLRVDQLVQDRQAVAREAEAISRAFDRAGGGIERFTANIRSASSAAATALGVIASAAIPAAQRVGTLEARFRLLLGSERRAVEEMARLREAADRTGQPFLDLAETAAGLIPAIRGTNAELASVMDIAQRLQVADPTARAYDISVGLREFLSGEYTSIARRFELDRNRVQSILQQASGDQAEALRLLGEYLDEMGITQEMTEELGRTGVHAFRAMRSELTETLAIAGEPLLNDFILPAVRGFNTLLRTVREVNPEMLRLSGIIAGIVGLPSLANRLGNLVGIAGVGRVANIGIAATAGAVAGGRIAQGAASLGVGDRRVADMELSDVLKTAFVTFLAGIGKAREALVELGATLTVTGVTIARNFLTAVTNIEEGVGHFVTNLGIFLSRLGLDTGGMAMSGVDIVTRATERRNEIDRRAAELAGRVAEKREQELAAIEDWTHGVVEFGLRLTGGQEAVDRFNGTLSETAMAAENAAQAVRSAGDGLTFSDEQLNAWAEYQQEIADLQAETAERIAEASADYQRRRLEAIAGAAERRQELAREQADREQEHQEKLRDIHEQYSKDLLALDEEYQRKRERLTRQHHSNLLEAAAALDAEAVWAENNRYAEQLDVMKDNHAEQKEKLAEQLAERLEAENEAWEKQRAQYARRLAEIDRQLGKELESMARSHQERLNQLRLNLARELEERQRAFAQEFNQLATHESQKLAIQRQGMAQLEAELRQWWNRMQASLGNYAAITQAAPTTSTFGARTSTSYPTSQTGLPQSTRLGGYQIPEFYSSLSFQPSSYRTVGTTTITDERWWDAVQSGYSGGYQVPAFQHGGRVLKTGLAYLHADEEVLRPDVARTLRAAHGGVIDQDKLGKSGVVWNGDVNITEPGASAEQIRRTLIDALLEIAG